MDNDEELFLPWTFQLNFRLLRRSLKIGDSPDRDNMVGNFFFVAEVDPFLDSDGGGFNQRHWQP